jgi:hypothetical protein
LLDGTATTSSKRIFVGAHLAYGTFKPAVVVDVSGGAVASAAPCGPCARGFLRLAVANRAVACDVPPKIEPGNASIV